METHELISLFLYELEEELNEYTSSLMAFEKNTSDSDKIDDLYICVHTIKGSSNTLLNSLPKDRLSIRNPLQSITIITHNFEDILDFMKDKNTTLSKDEVEILFVFEKLLIKLHNEISSETGVGHSREVAAFVKKLEGLSGKMSTENVVTEQSATKKHFVELTLDCDPDFKHGYLSLIYRYIEEEYEEHYFTPSKEDLLKGEDFTYIAVQITSSQSQNQIETFLTSLKYIDSIKYLPFENSVTTIKEESLIPKEDRHEQIKKHRNHPLRIEPRRIDNVLKHTSKLVILKNKLDEFLSQNDFLAGTQKRKELEGIFDDINLHVDLLQQGVLEIRMTPFEQLFSRFPRDVRTLSDEYEKPIDFKTYGAGTEIDKTILDDLFEPFMHLIRNAIIHGIETPEERKAIGKPERGTITIIARHDKNRVLIDITDDGHGIDVEKLKKSVLEKGHFTQQTIDSLSREEAFELIFQSGVSLSDKVNEYAGRGIGMEAVRKKIDELNGAITIKSEKMMGTTITLSLPLTTSIIEGMITKINGEYFTFPISQVEEVISIKKSEIKDASGQHFFFLRQKEIPIIYGNDFFDFKAEENEDEPFLMVMVVRSQSQLIALSINQYLGQQSVVVKSLHPFIQNTNGISNCHILGDGSISLIIDTNDLSLHLIQSTEDD